MTALPYICAQKAGVYKHENLCNMMRLRNSIPDLLGINFLEIIKT